MIKTTNENWILFNFWFAIASCFLIDRNFYFYLTEASQATNEMQKLEEQQQVVSDSTTDAAAPTKGVLFVRGETQNTDEMGGETKNPEEIELADSDDSESDESESDKEEEEKDVPQQKEVPSEVRFYDGDNVTMWSYLCYAVNPASPKIVNYNPIITWDFLAEIQLLLLLEVYQARIQTIKSGNREILRRFIFFPVSAPVYINLHV